MPLVAVPLMATLTVRALAVGPVRVRVNWPLLLGSPATASFATTVTTGKSSFWIVPMAVAVVISAPLVELERVTVKSSLGSMVVSP